MNDQAQRRVILAVDDKPDSELVLVVVEDMRADRSRLFLLRVLFLLIEELAERVLSALLPGVECLHQRIVPLLLVRLL